MTHTWFSRITTVTLRPNRSVLSLRRLVKRLRGATPILHRPLALCSLLLLAIFTGTATLNAQTSPFLGDWRVPSGTIVRIDPCSSGFCMRIMFLSPKADATTDIHNPDATLRARSLCNLELGSRFHPNDATHASGGTIYDPKSGNTYRGQRLWKVTSCGCAAMLDSHCSAERRFGAAFTKVMHPATSPHLAPETWDRATEIAADSQDNVAQLYFEIIFSHYEISIDVRSRASMLLRVVCSGRTEAHTPCCTAHIIAGPGLVATPRPIYGDAARPPRVRSLPRHRQRAFP